RLDRLNERSHVRVGAQPAHVIPREPSRELAAVRERPSERRPDEVPPRFAPAGLDVAVPEHGLVADARPGPPDEPPHHERRRQVEPDDDVCAVRDQIAEHAVIRRVGHPVVAPGRLEHALAQHLRAARLPVGTVMERVDLDRTQPGNARELVGERRLAAAARTGDRDPHGSWSSPRATRTAEPPTSIRSTASAVPSARANSVDRRPISTPCSISISSPKAMRPCRARWSASGPAAEPVAGSSAMPRPGPNMRSFHRRPEPAKQLIPSVPYSPSSRIGGSSAATSSREPSATYTCGTPLS